MANPERLLAVASTLGICLSAGGARAGEHSDALLVVARGGGIEAEVVDDLTELLHFAVKKAANDQDFRFLPKERVKARLGYESPREPGGCVLDRECLRKAHVEMGTRWFVVVRLEPDGARYRLVVTRVGGSPDEDVEKVGESLKGAADVMNAARPLVLQSLETPAVTLSLSVNEPDALVEVNDQEVGKGSVSIAVKPGAYRIRVTKEGFVPFQAKVVCKLGSTCVVSANVFAVPSVPPKAPDRILPDERPDTKPIVLPGDRDDTPRTLLVLGWSVAGVGIAMAAVGIAFGVDTLATGTYLDDHCQGGQCDISRAEADEWRRRGETGATIFNAVGVPGMVLAAGGLATAIVGHVLGSRGVAGKAEVEVQPSLGPEGSVLLRGSVSF